MKCNIFLNVINEKLRYVLSADLDISGALYLFCISMELSLKTNSILSIVFRFLFEDRCYLLYIRKRSSEDDNIDYCSKQRNTVKCGQVST